LLQSSKQSPRAVAGSAGGIKVNTSSTIPQASLWSTRPKALASDVLIAEQNIKRLTLRPSRTGCAALRVRSRLVVTLATAA